MATVKWVEQSEQSVPSAARAGMCKLRALRGGIITGLLGLAIAGQASAGCKIAAPQQAPARSSPSKSLFISAVYRPMQSTDAVLTPVFDRFADNGSIVGLWEFQVHATQDEGPFHKGDLLDWGLATWHRDGTEIQFSAGRPPSAGDVCMGVWKQTAYAKYHLNHIALGEDLATGSAFDGLTNIRADVTVNRSGDSFTGSYQIIQYAGNPADGTEFDQSSVQYQFMGTITATRVTPD